MPRCYNDSKTVSSVSGNYKHSTDDIILTQSHAFSIGNQLNVDEDPPVVEKSHRRLRCDLSPVPTSTNSNLNIKLLSLKVRFYDIFYDIFTYVYFYVFLLCLCIFLLLYIEVLNKFIFIRKYCDVLRT